MPSWRRQLGHNSQSPHPRLSKPVRVRWSGLKPLTTDGKGPGPPWWRRGLKTGGDPIQFFREAANIRKTPRWKSTSEVPGRIATRTGISVIPRRSPEPFRYPTPTFNQRPWPRRDLVEKTRPSLDRGQASDQAAKLPPRSSLLNPREVGSGAGEQTGSEGLMGEPGDAGWKGCYFSRLSA